MGFIAPNFITETHLDTAVAARLEPVPNSAVIDFGATPASNASVFVAAPSITASSFPIARIAIGSTPTNNVQSHRTAVASCSLVCGDIVPGVGFTIEAVGIRALATGSFLVQWALHV